MESKYSPEFFIEKVKESKTMQELMQKLGMTNSGGNYKVIINKSRRLNVDITHLYTRMGDTKYDVSAVTDASFVEAVKACKSVSAVIKQLGFKPAGSTNRWVREKIVELNLDISHFLGQGWLLNKSHNFVPKKDINNNPNPYSRNGQRHFKKRLLEDGTLKNECYICKMGPTWLGKPITLQMDHINGNRYDNSIENLRILCPNCHAQTETYMFKNSHKYKKCENDLAAAKCSKCNGKMSANNKTQICHKCRTYKFQVAKND